MKPVFLTHSMFLLSTLIFIPTSGGAQKIESGSTITAVTVYSDQALITRTAKINVPPGVHSVVFTGLPVRMIDKSLKVAGASDARAKISDIKVEKRYLDSIPEAQGAQLTSRLEELKTEKNALEKTNLLYKSQVDAVETLRENYSRGLASPGQKSTIEEWEKVLQYCEKKKTDYWGKMATVQTEIQSKVEKIKAIEEQLRGMGSRLRKEEKEVDVILNTEVASALEFEISYLIPEAGWTPSYEVRASSVEKTLQLVYSGNVSQSSGEDWNNVDITLSTAQPSTSGWVPTLSRWTIDTRPMSSQVPSRPRHAPIRSLPPPSPISAGNTLSGRVLDAETDDPLPGANVVLEGTSLGGSTDLDGNYVIYNVPEGTYSARASYIGYKGESQADVHITRLSGANQVFYLQATMVQGQAVVVTAQASRAQAAVNQQLAAMSMTNVVSESSTPATQATSSSFSIPSKQSVPGDNKEHKVGISVENFPIVLSYEIVPKLVQGAFLKARGRNVAPYPLLGGDANVFLDNSFVASLPLKTIMPEDSFSVGLGVDDGIRVSRRMLGRYTESVGTFSSKTRVRYEFETTVENHKKAAIDATVIDQIPVSSDEKILVEIIEPKGKLVAPDGDGMLKWKLRIEPGGKEVIGLAFTVEYPPEVVPYGLE